MPFRVSQQQQPWQPQQQYWFPSCLRGPSTLLRQSWQVGICRACQGRVQTCSGDALASKKQPEPGGLVGNCSNRRLAHLLLTAMIESTPSVKPASTDIRIIRKPQRAQCFTEPAIQLDLMLIPAGTFTMGSPSGELGRRDWEGPQHEVTVSTFLMGRYPVTQAQWRAIATRTDLKVKHDLEPEPSQFKGADHPVEQVSWYEAVEFCQRLSRLTHHTYRLPTEAEWEYGCRASPIQTSGTPGMGDTRSASPIQTSGTPGMGDTRSASPIQTSGTPGVGDTRSAGTTTPFHFGETITTDLANYCGEDNESQPEKYPGHYGRGPKGEYRKSTTPITHFHPFANAFGLCDMHGNVWEWCLDHWHGNYEGAPTDGSAWLTENDEADRVVRGGSWDDDPRICRSACRLINTPGYRYYNIGFRVVCEVRGL